MGLRRGLLALALGLVPLLAACGGDDDLSAPIREEHPGPGFTDRTVRVRLAMEVSGAEELSLDTETILQTIEIVGSEVPRITWFLSVSAAEIVELPDGRRLQFSADLTPGLYEGPGSYTLTEEGAVEVEGQQSPLGSGAYVQFLRLDPETSTRRFDRFAEPCTIEVDKDQRRGRVECPSLADAEGETVSLTWSWERV